VRDEGPERDDVEREGEVEDLPDLDYADPLKRRREGEPDPGGLDPTLTIPGED
jgi:hypothetical protein